jgi:hypothetical protein
MKTLSPTTFSIATLAATALLLVGAVIAPHNPYFRWQELETKFSRKGDWIYERLHFDDTPIDVALIGTSRTAAGISGPDIERAYCETVGRRIRVVNLGFPGVGRNLQYAIAKEAVAAKKPRLLLVEVNEHEQRVSHESFIVAADSVDILTAPIANRNFIADVGRLPGRQLSLFYKTVAGAPNVTRGFDPSAYEGADNDQTRVLRMIDGTLRSRFVQSNDKDFAGDLRAHRRDKKKAKISKSLESIGYAAVRHYLRRIELLARNVGGDVQYVFIPAFEDPAMPKSVFRQLDIEGPVIDLGGPVAMNRKLWRDATHTNAWGSIQQSLRLGRELARAHPRLGVVGCDPATLGGVDP